VAELARTDYVMKTDSEELKKKKTINEWLYQLYEEKFGGYEGESGQDVIVKEYIPDKRFVYILLFKEINKMVDLFKEILLRVPDEGNLKIRMATDTFQLDISKKEGNWQMLIKSLIEDYPVEDGYSHPAEEILKEVIFEDNIAFKEWLLQLEKEDEALFAEVLRLLGRIEPTQIEDWYLEIAKIALANSNIEVRDAAVQAIELWATPKAFSLLREHCEQTSWLKEYIDRIIKQNL